MPFSLFLAKQLRLLGLRLLTRQPGYLRLALHQHIVGENFGTYIAVMTNRNKN